MDPVIVWIVRLALALLFAAAAYDKLRDPVRFRAVLVSYRLVPASLVPALGWLILLLETGVAIALLLGFPPAVPVAAIALLFYALVMGANLARDRRLLDCGCGGERQPLSWPLVARNVVIAAIAFVGAFPADARELGWLDGVTIVAGVGVLALLYAAANELIAARARMEEWV